MPGLRAAFQPRSGKLFVDLRHQPLQPGVDPVTFPARLATYTAGVAAQVATYPHVLAEPPLKAYARG